MHKILIYITVAAAGLISCSPGRYLATSQQALMLDTALAGAHVGISMYDPAANKYIYNYQGDKYFTPASNTKLFTCYAAMKYLGDSLVAARYMYNRNRLFIWPAADPTFLHPDFDSKSLLQLIQSGGDSIFISLSDVIKKYGPGWSWDDYAEDYMPERSILPIYGNVVSFNRQPLYSTKFLNDSIVDGGRLASLREYWVKPVFFAKELFSFDLSGNNFFINRLASENLFGVKASTTPFQHQQVPFITDNINTAVSIIETIFKKKVIVIASSGKGHLTIHSQPTDSMLKPMMHRSDNFFAEQSLLMVSNEKLGYMNDEAIIDTLLKTDLKELPQKPVWVDGSGLSRYNQFTPQDIITLLLKIKNEFGIERIRNILPKGNTGTLTNFYQKLGSNIFAKTGTLSGQVALSGYLICRSGRLLLFSVMVNNHNSTGRAVRRAVEKFVTGVWERN